MKNVNAARLVPPAPYPGSKDLGPFTRLARMTTSQIDGLPKDVYELDTWCPPFPGMPLFIMDPDLIKAVLLDEAEDFPQGALFSRIMKPVWGEGLLLSQGDAWKSQRRAAAIAFRAGSMAALTPFFVQATERALQRWQARGFGQMDLLEEMKRLTFDIIIDTMLSGAEEIDRDALRLRIGALFADISKLKLSYLVRGDAYHAGRRSQTSVHRAPVVLFLSNLINARRAVPPRGDLLDHLISAEDPDSGRGLSDDQLIDNILGFILAGCETTSVALTWTLYLIASDAPTRARLLEEVHLQLGQAPVSKENIGELRFTGQVISEALRIYPPAFMLTRIVGRDRMFGDRRLKAGQRINIPIWAVHRQARNWPDPHAFDPDRFDPESPAPDRYTYMPFGAGPRICIGAAFAMTEMTAVIATLLSTVEITPPPRQSVWPETGLALTPRGGMSVTIRPL